MKKLKHNWTCKDCNLKFETKAKLYEHRYAKHNIKKRNTTKICKYCNQYYGKRFSEHRKICPSLRHEHTHTEETKKHLSDIRKAWLKNNPDKHPWKRKDKFKSIPCEHLKEILKQDGYSFIEEYTDKRWIHNYSIDIAFIDKKLAIEINGQQHYNSDGTLKEYYQKRHDYLISCGWIINEIYYVNCYKSDEIDKIKTSINNLETISDEEHQILFSNMAKKKEIRDKERQEQFELAKKEGRLNNNGTRIVAGKLSFFEWNKRKELIINSGINLMKYGWIEKVKKKTGLTTRELSNTIKYFSNYFNGKVYRRK